MTRALALALVLGLSAAGAQVCTPPVCTLGGYYNIPVNTPVPAGTPVITLPRPSYASNMPQPWGQPCGLSSDIVLKYPVNASNIPVSPGTVQMTLINISDPCQKAVKYPIINFCADYQKPTVTCTNTILSCNPGDVLTPAQFGCSVAPAAGGGGPVQLRLFTQWGMEIKNQSSIVCPNLTTLRLTVGSTKNTLGCAANVMTTVTPAPVTVAAVGRCYSGGVLTPAPTVGSVGEPGTCNTTWNMTDFSAIFPGKGYAPGYISWAGWDNYTQMSFNTIPLWLPTNPSGSAWGYFDSIVSNVPLYGYNAGASHTWGADWPCNFDGRIYSTSNGTQSSDSVTLSIPTGVTALSLVVDTYGSNDLVGDQEVTVTATTYDGTPATINLSQTLNQLGTGQVKSAKLFGFYAGNGWLTSITISGPPGGVAFGELVGAGNIVCAP